MHVLGLTATQFIKPMSTGRNRPLLLGCQSASGERFEVVVKLRGAEMNEKAQIAELISAQLADDLGLAVPLGAIVELPIGFDAAVPDPSCSDLGARKSRTEFRFGPPRVRLHDMARRSRAARRSARSSGGDFCI